MTTAPAGPSSARADLYALLAELTSFPSPQLGAALAAGDVDVVVEHQVSHLPFALPKEGALSPTATHPTGLEAEYIRLFDVPDGAGTPLYTGVYARRRRDAMEELLRFYRHFGLTLASDAHDLPDYAPTVLEFLGVLSLGVDSATSGPGGRRAQADVLERHLIPWVQETRKRLAGRQPHPFYAALIELIANLAETDLAWLREAAPTVPQPSPSR